VPGGDLDLLPRRPRAPHLHRGRTQPHQVTRPCPAERRRAGDGARPNGPRRRLHIRRDSAIWWPLNEVGRTFGHPPAGLARTCRSVPNSRYGRVSQRSAFGRSTWAISCHRGASLGTDQSPSGTTDSNPGQTATGGPLRIAAGRPAVRTSSAVAALNTPVSMLHSSSSTSLRSAWRRAESHQPFKDPIVAVVADRGSSPQRFDVEVELGRP